MKLAMIMDPIEDITVKKDTSFAILLEAQQRGYQNYYLQQESLFLRDGVAYAKLQAIKVFDDPKYWFELDNAIIVPLSEMNMIFFRTDPPLTMQYIYTTQILELVEKTGVIVVNKPQSLRDFNEKLFISYFPQCCVPMLVSSDLTLIKKFLAEQHDIICKPLDGMGGQGIFRVRENDANLNAIVETITKNGQAHLMAQRYIPEIIHGDKRILLIDGEPVAYALARIPQSGEVRANLAAGGTGVAQALTERDRWICEQVTPMLKAKGLYFVGIDVIGDYLTEINITSPTCARELDAQCGLNIAGQLLDALERKK